MFDYSHYIIDILKYLLNYVIVGAEALEIMLIGYIIAEYLKKFVTNSLLDIKTDPTLVKFAINCIYPIIIICAAITALNKLGVQTTSLTAIIGVTGLAISLAFQNSMSNLASGLILIALRPFRIGDYVSLAGVKGTLEEIQILVCILRNDNNDIIIMPNSKIIADQIINFTKESQKRIELEITLSAKQDFTTTKQVIERVLTQNELILKNPEPKIYVKDITPNGTVICIKPWVSTKHQNYLLQNLNEHLKKAFSEHNILLAESTK